MVQQLCFVALLLLVLAFTEGTVNAAAFDLHVQSLNEWVFLVDASFGPAGNGIDIHTPGGYNVGLGECALGFQGAPILVADFTLIKPFTSIQPCLEFELLPNLDASTSGGLISDCTGTLRPCDLGWALGTCPPLPVESTSFGAVKSLYGSH